MEKELKSQLVQVADVVKKKIRDMRSIELQKENMLESVFKPILTPLNKIVEDKKNIETKEFFKDTIKESSPLISPGSHFNKTLSVKKSASSPHEEISEEETDDDNFEDFNKTNTSNQSFRSVSSVQSPGPDYSSWSLSSEAYDDVPFGVRRERGKLMMGSLRVNINNDEMCIAGRVYKQTPGLYELLFKKIPNLDLVTAKDSQQYKAMLIDTNAHRRDFDPCKPIKSNKGRKYLHIIKPLFKLRKPSSSSISSVISDNDDIIEGQGIFLKKKLKKNTDYIYWNDPNELVERLKLLIASKDAGNTGMENEIIAILEELRESGIIK